MWSKHTLDDVLYVYDMKNTLFRRHVLNQSTNQRCLMSSWQHTVLLDEYLMCWILTPDSVIFIILWALVLGYNLQKNRRRLIVYRSYKHFDEITYKRDMADTPHHVGEVFDDINDKCWLTKKLISSVIGETLFRL